MWRFLQDLINFFYRHPKSAHKRILGLGGYRQYLWMLRMQRLMKNCANKLMAIPSHPDGHPIYFLTGKNFLYQTLFCIKSLTDNSSEKFKFFLVDDGTFDQAIISQIKRQLPGAEIVLAAAVENNLAMTLPRAQYPNLRRKRDEYPHLKKLTDIHTLPTGNWKMVLDSDMLFFDEPREILRWLKLPEEPIHMVDCMESYGYSRALMEELSGANIPPLVNVGLIGLNSESIDWRQLESWIGQLESKGGKTYYLEQALTAMLLAGVKCLRLDSKEYFVNPDRHSIESGFGTLHHYVASSKIGYFTDAWRKYS